MTEIPTIEETLESGYHERVLAQRKEYIKQKQVVWKKTPEGMKYLKEYYSKNKEAFRLRAIKWRANHPELSEKRKQSYKENPEPIREKNRRYYLRNRERICNQKKMRYNERKQNEQSKEEMQ